MESTGQSTTETACPHLRALNLEPPTERPLDDPAYFSELRQECPISEVRVGGQIDAWLVTKFDDVKSILGDLRFSSNPTKPGFPVVGLPGSDHPQVTEGMLRQDPPVHTQLRRVILRFFTPRAVEGYRDQVTAIIDEHIDRLAELDRPIDLISDFALSIPTTVITQLLGVPIETAPRFHDLTERLTTLSLPREEMWQVVDEFRDFSLELADEKDKNPADDLLTWIVKEHEEVGISRDQLAALITSLVVGGHDTTAGMIGLSILTLLQHPDQLALLTSGERQWDVAIEELLRVLSVARMGPRRAALEDVEVGGQLIKQGEGVIASIWSANHDEAKYENTRWEDFTIPETKPKHLAFSFGPHQCVGQSLARLELMLAVPKIFERYPNLRLLEPDVAKLEFRGDRAFYGLKSLPVEIQNR